VVKAGATTGPGDLLRQADARSNILDPAGLPLRVL
jgi:hypothetical protein